jgi:hypothetical protein
MTASKVFDLSGNIFEVAGNGQIQGAQDMGRAIGGVFGGGALTGGSAAAPEFRSLSVLITYESPSAPPVSQRRVLLKAEDLKQEHVPSPMLQWDLLVLPQVLTSRAAGYDLLSHAVALVKPALTSLKGEDPSPPFASGRPPEPFSPLLDGLATLRQQGLARVLGKFPGVAVVWDAPFVAIAEKRMCVNKAGRHFCQHSAIDIVQNGMSFVPRDATGTADAVKAAMRQGIYETAAEAMLLKSAVPDETMLSAIGESERAREAGAALAVLTPQDDLASKNIVLPEGDAKWIRQYEPAGRRVLITTPAGGVSATTWWSLDPATGTVLGRSSGGRGQAQTEYKAVINLVSFHACMISPIYDAANTPNIHGKQAAKLVIQILACFGGLNTGFVGTIPWGATMGANQMLLIWAGITVGLKFVDKILS